MSIKFNCPNCQKSLKVSAELAGKKGRCPGCHQALRVPTLELDVTPDAEALAAAALADEPPPAAAPEQEQQTTITFQCPQCDETVQVSGDLAGKQTPCPECHRIVKVPLPKKLEPKDWRKAEPRGPAAGLRKDELADVPEGAWGTNISKTTVSRQALEEAEAIPAVKVRRTAGQWVSLGVKAAMVLGAVGIAYWGIRHQSTEHSKDKALKLALPFLPPPGKGSGTQRLDNLAAAAGYRALGAYYLRRDTPEDRDRARAHFNEARAKLMTAPTSPERHALLIDLALSQIDLGGTTEEIAHQLRLKWNEVNNDLRQTLTKLDAAPSDAREEALLAVSRKLIAKGQGDLAATAATLLGGDKERPQMEAIVGVEFLLADDRKAAETRATSAAKPYEDRPRKDENAPAFLALLVALDQEPRADKILMAVPVAGKDPYRLARLGYAQGWAFQDKWEPARQLAGLPGPAVDRLEALVALAAIAAQKKPAEAPPLIDAAMALVDGELQNKAVSSWLLLRLVRLAVQVGQAERVRPLANSNRITDAGLRGRAQLALLQADLAAHPRVDSEALETAAKQPKPHPLLLEFLARNNTRYGSTSAVLKAIAAWEPETLRPFGYLGVALGEQDGGQ